MMQWWLGLTLAGQIYAFIAIFASVVLIAQIILMLLGLGGHGDTDGDFSGDSGGDVDADGDVDGDIDGSDGDGSGIYGDDAPDTGNDFSEHEIDSGLRLFTLRGITAFLAVTGWTGVIFVKSEMMLPLAIALSLICGFAAMLLLALMFKGMIKLQDNGNINIKNAIGLSGSAYLPIPPSRTGKGKVMITVQGRYSEYDAMTDSENKIPTGSDIFVTGVSGDTLLVKTKK